MNLKQKYHLKAVLNNKLIALHNLPKEFNFKSVPLVTIKIIAPYEGEIIKGKTLKIKYAIEGNLLSFRHVHWTLDNLPDHHDIEPKGYFEITLSGTGLYKLAVWQVLGHHDKIINSDV